MVFSAFPSGCKEHLSGLRFYVALPAHRPQPLGRGHGTVEELWRLVLVWSRRASPVLGRWWESAWAHTVPLDFLAFGEEPELAPAPILVSRFSEPLHVWSDPISKLRSYGRLQRQSPQTLCFWKALPSLSSRVKVC